MKSSSKTIPEIIHRKGFERQPWGGGKLTEDKPPDITDSTVDFMKEIKVNFRATGSYAAPIF